MKSLKIKGESVGEMKFLIKMFLGTMILIYVMQLKVGDRTIESRAYSLLAQSKLTVFINTVAHGLIEVGQEFTDYLQLEIKKQEKKLKESKP